MKCTDCKHGHVTKADEYTYSFTVRHRWSKDTNEISTQPETCETWCVFYPGWERVSDDHWCSKFEPGEVVEL